MRILSGYKNTKTNGEDFALTPYLFYVHVNEKIIKFYGIGVCFGFWSLYVGIGFGIQKKYAGFRILKN